MENIRKMKVGSEEAKMGSDFTVEGKHLEVILFFLVCHKGCDTSEVEIVNIARSGRVSRKLSIGLKNVNAAIAMSVRLRLPT
ncbi:hypothetical protein CEXT_111611 [Caerostris extrusa]|uniref:Uncharacterized protein n=1 Tax=Caerostris extrusa TaxID=172846 RepID=A0AAV4T552_CAEEX|nr:hypothetical protein CEXT_111611 [Caerostris extrusa]